MFATRPSGAEGFSTAVVPSTFSIFNVAVADIFFASADFEATVVALITIS